MISPTNGESKTLEEFFARIGKLTKYAITLARSTDMSRTQPRHGRTARPTGT